MEGKMFDKLIESNSEGAEFKNRRSYFMVSTVVVGLLFLAAVVASIYAGEIGIGNGDLELSELMAPIAPEIQPEPPRPPEQRNASQQTSETPTRQVNMLRPEEQPFSVPPISVVPNSHLSRPPGHFDFGPDSGPSTLPGTGRDTTGGNEEGTGLGPDPKPRVEELKTESDPPPAIKPPKPIIRSIGVANGIATLLPKPVYPATALALNIQGKVDVQITIDETGKVISAKAASGHPLLRPAAERAAWSARFTPTTLSKVPVKVTGVIVYNFTRN
jgi:TonB family protein